MKPERDSKIGAARHWPQGCFRRVRLHPQAGPAAMDARDFALPGCGEAAHHILRLVCHSSGAGFAAVAQACDGAWTACAVHDALGLGLRRGEAFVIEALPRAPGRASLEPGALGAGPPVVIDHLVEDRYATSYGRRSVRDCGHFASVPIPRAGGGHFGILCAVKRRQPHMNPRLLDTLELFAKLLGFHLDAHEQIRAANRALSRELEISRMREQFLAMLGHDLRNPLGAIDAGIAVLDGAPADQMPTMLEMIRRSVDRMTGLIDTLADLARVRLGKGLSLQRDSDLPLWPMLEQVVSEQRMAWPGRVIVSSIARDGGVDCDRHRIAQLLSNLLGNALVHGAPDAPVQVECSVDAGALSIAVANSGEPIPQGMLERIFLPFTRRPTRPGPQGLGLGLYICAEIARAHGGTLQVDSTPARTCFSFRLPLSRSVSVDRLSGSQGNAGPPQVSLTPAGGGLGAARPWGRS